MNQFYQRRVMDSHTFVVGSDGLCRSNVMNDERTESMPTTTSVAVTVVFHSFASCRDARASRRAGRQTDRQTDAQTDVATVGGLHGSQTLTCLISRARTAHACPPLGTRSGSAL